MDKGKNRLERVAQKETSEDVGHNEGGTG
jgi:hypothetical protein